MWRALQPEHPSPDAKNLKGSLLSIKSPVFRSSNGSGPSFGASSAMAARLICGTYLEHGLTFDVQRLLWSLDIFEWWWICDILLGCFFSVFWLAFVVETLDVSWNLNTHGKSDCKCSKKPWGQYLTSTRKTTEHWSLEHKHLLWYHFRSEIGPHLPAHQTPQVCRHGGSNLVKLVSHRAWLIYTKCSLKNHFLEWWSAGGFGWHGIGKSQAGETSS